MKSLLDEKIDILIIEDNVDLCANMWDFLECKGHTVDGAHDGATGLKMATERGHGAIVLDLGLPGIDGLEICRRLRMNAEWATPILMLTARDTLQDKLLGFESGADDYLVKPFELEELEARLLALVKRTKQSLSARLLQVADLTLDLDTLSVRRGGQPIKLARRGLQILELLMRESHRVVSRQELEAALWGDEPPDTDALRAHIHSLRSAIDKPFPTSLVQTIHGIGYRLAESPHESDEKNP